MHLTVDDRKEVLRRLVGDTIDPAEIYTMNARELFKAECEYGLKPCLCCPDKNCNECVCDVLGCPNYEVAA